MAQANQLGDLSSPAAGAEPVAVGESQNQPKQQKNLPGAHSSGEIMLYNMNIHPERGGVDVVLQAA